MNATSGSMGDQVETGTSNANQDAARVKDHIRAAGAAATDAVREQARVASESMREQARMASEAMRDQARYAQDWARSRMSGLQQQVQSDPYRATMWALGLGVAAGLLLASLMRSGRS